MADVGIGRITLIDTITMMPRRFFTSFSVLAVLGVSHECDRLELSVCDFTFLSDGFNRRCAY